ncbi:MAG: hypothetical protein OXI63_13005 [Candidatus Poribacteria bacterium]|nr:hypothetical protein [Candidatus Poribacteria bacterium]
MLVRKLDTIMLTANDLPTMELDTPMSGRSAGVRKEPPTVDGFYQTWDGTQPEKHIMYIRYWLFRTVADTQNAADEWRSFIAAAAIQINGQRVSAYQPEPNAEDVIGDATWRIANDASIWFMKNNVLVLITANQLPLTRSVARKIETKINAALSQP